MKKSLKLVKIVVSALLCMFIIIFPKNFVHAQSTANTRTGIAPDKEWYVNFTNNVDYNYVNSNYIYAKDSFGNAVALDSVINPTNPKQVIVKPKDGKYVLGKTYVLTISKDFSDEKGHKIGKDYEMQFTIKSQLIDTADFNVKSLDYGSGIISTVAINSTTLSNAKTYKVDGQDDSSNIAIGEEAYICGNLDNVNVYFYDGSGNEIGSCLINIKKPCDSQIVQITN